MGWAYHSAHQQRMHGCAAAPRTRGSRGRASACSAMLVAVLTAQLLTMAYTSSAAASVPWALDPDYLKDAATPFAQRCGCANRTLCDPITTPPPAKELFVFLEASGPGNMTHDFYSWEWGGITTVAVCNVEALPPLAMAALTCRAHAAGARYGLLLYKLCPCCCCHYQHCHPQEAHMV